MARTPMAVTLPQQSVTLDTNAAPDAPAPNVGPTAFGQNFNVSGGVANGSITATAPDANTAANTSTNNTEQTQTVLNTLSNGDLPWAKVALPTTSAGQGGVGEGRHGLKPETWVYGIFLDGDACQQPLVLGVISGGPGGAYSGGSGGSGGGGGGDGGTFNGNVPKGGNNSETCYKLLVANGYSPQNAAGILGNLLNEGAVGGGDINPNQNEIGGGGGFGIAQWTSADRKAGLKRVAGSQYNTIEGQTKYLIHELKTSEKVAERLLANARGSVAASTKAFMNFERPKGYKGSLARNNGGDGIPPGDPKLKQRVATAEKFYQKMMSKGATSTPAAASNTAPTTPRLPTTFANQPAPSFTPARNNTPTS